MYMIPHKMEYNLSGIIDMNGNIKALIWAELELLALKYGLEVEVIKDEVHQNNTTIVVS